MNITTEKEGQYKVKNTIIEIFLNTLVIAVDTNRSNTPVKRQIAILN